MNRAAKKYAAKIMTAPLNSRTGKLGAELAELMKNPANTAKLPSRTLQKARETFHHWPELRMTEDG